MSLYNVVLSESDIRTIADCLLASARGSGGLTKVLYGGHSKHELVRLACKLERALDDKPSPVEPLVSLAEMIRKPNVKDW